MTLGMNFSGKNFHPGDPNLLQFCFAATGSQLAAIDTRSGDAFGDSAAFVIARREPFSGALIETEPQIFFHVVWQSRLYA